MFHSMWNQFRQYMTCGGNSANEMDNTMAAAAENCGGPIQNLPRFKRRSVVQKMFSSIDRPDDDPTTSSKPQAVSLILLGAAQSGKSTLFRQLEILHGNCFSTMYERLNYRPIINENLLVSMNILIKQLPHFQLTVTTPGAEKDLEEFKAFLEHYTVR